MIGKYGFLQVMKARPICANYVKMQKSCHRLFIVTKQPSKFFCGKLLDLVINYFDQPNSPKINHILTVGNNYMMN
jgi:hypothetical protein